MTKRIKKSRNFNDPLKLAEGQQRQYKLTTKPIGPPFANALCLYSLMIMLPLMSSAHYSEKLVEPMRD